ncbi:hypothetical protein MMAD_34000 [Mycolicibacterium madagascariense]|uniref:Uncharacterized protein n=1 Tax=Mycolicibacterium madagascariense TaxID=212765 RepID=A0A7I7XJ35_9MYCO|nr:hypothetical protein [Mycolicibacterium madagascariense]MCV7010997.1 hypothetical protein [Mycolicibacterium madagascariense]BBZ29105.1 hypothetical protein MMAD_34000 [Mycolicibacterium madagascariense]
MTNPQEPRTEEHLAAEEDDGSAELQPEDGGSAASPPDKPSSAPQS